MTTLALIFLRIVDGTVHITGWGVLFLLLLAAIISG